MTTSTPRDLSHYFEYGDAGVEVLQDGLEEMTFGEYLVDRGALTREQLLEALFEQEKNPGVSLAEVIAFLGFMPYAQVDVHLSAWNKLPVLEIA
jgi:hypothetical protein